ncbi:MAG: DUF3944 domain-containing protein [Rhodanobacter sp.]|jgi:uncharacterized protein YaaW (UPF0174 family)
MLKFREDADLSVLALASHDDLARLARVLTHDESDGKERYTQKLLEEPSYKAAVEKGDMRAAWKAIAAELQTFGGDTIVNQIRGMTKDYTGVTYREILGDIRELLKLNFKPADDITTQEDQLLVGLVLGYMDDFQFADLVQIMDGFAKGADGDAVLRNHAKYLQLVQGIAHSLGSVAGALGKVARGEGFSKRALFLGASVLTKPAALGVSVPPQISGPAFRVTVLAVLEVIRIRRVVLLAPMNEGGRV